MRAANETELVALDKSGAYLELEAAFAQGAIQILDHPSLLRELKNLERRNRVGGKTVIDHPSGGHDDHANALALACARVASRGTPWSHAVIPDGIIRLGAPREHVSGAIPQAGVVGGQAARTSRGDVGGQAAGIRRWYR